MRVRCATCGTCCARVWASRAPRCWPRRKKPTLLAAGTPEAVEAGFDAGAVIKAISGNIKGGGGGKAAMAQAGGKDASGIDAALQAARDMLL